MAHLCPNCEEPCECQGDDGRIITTDAPPACEHCGDLGDDDLDDVDDDVDMGDELDW